MKNLRKLTRVELKGLAGGKLLPGGGGGGDACPSKCTVTQGQYTTTGTCSKGQGNYSQNCYCSADSAGATLC